MFKLDSIVKALLVALALIGTISLSSVATAAPATESGDAWYYKHTGGVPPQ